MIKKSPNLEKLARIAAYYSTHRGRGHTWAMVHGAANTNGCIVIVGQRADEDYLRRMVPPDAFRRLRFISWHDSNFSERMAGLDVPLVFDHHALQFLIEDVWQEFVQYREHNMRLDEELNAQRLINLDLERQRYDFIEQNLYLKNELRRVKALKQTLWEKFVVLREKLKQRKVK